MEWMNLSVTMPITGEELAEKIREMNENRIYLDKYSEDLRKKYPDMYVAVFKGKIVGNDPDMKKLIVHMRKKFGNIDTILIEFISGEDY